MRATPLGGPAGSDNRWQGYTHQELYDMLHAGPGTRAAGLTADTWSGLSEALADIQQDIGLGITQSGATWTGAAADSARGALGPLGDWAQQAAAAAELMQLSTVMQGELLDKARTDMPVPLPPAQPGDITPIRQLMSAQLDAERIEAAHDAAAQRAFQVMTDYESGTTDNTSTLGEFGTPPRLVVDTSPITGIPLSRTSADGMVERGRTFHPVRPAARVRPSALPEEEPLPERDAPATVRPAATVAEPAPEPAAEATQPPPETVTPAQPTTESSTTTPPGTPPERVITTTPATSAAPANPSPATSTPAPRRTTLRHPATHEDRPTHHETPGHRARASTTNNPGNQPSQNHPASSTTPSAATAPESGRPAPAPAPDQPAAAAPLVPSTRGGRRSEDEVIQPNVLILGEDIYGQQAYTPPVIGE